MIVPARVRDDVGRLAEPAITFLRYAVELGLAPQAGGGHRLVLCSEELRHVRVSDASSHLRFPHRASAFRSAAVTGRRSGTAFISTELTPTPGGDAVPYVRVHQDGGTGAEPAPTRADGAPRTILSTTTTSALPTMLAARRELQAWRRYSLDPATLRRPDPVAARAELAASGAGLAASLRRQLRADGAAPGGGVSARLSRLVEHAGVRVEVDPSRGVHTLQLREPGGHWLPSWALSDGTLRMIALAVLAGDRTGRGLICLEEPENGIHPARLDRVLSVLSGLAVDPSRAPGADNPLQQVILTTHSPSFVRLQRDGDLLVARSDRGAGANTPRGLQLRPLAGTWRCGASDDGIPRARLVQLLAAPVGGQVGLL